MRFVETRFGPAGRAIAIWISWIFVNVISSSIAVVVGCGLILLDYFDSDYIEPVSLSTSLLIDFAIAGLMMGLIVGSMQSLVLLSRFRTACLWIPLTGVGWSLGLVTIAFFGLQEYYIEVESPLFATIVVSSWFGIIGIAQWLFLRNRVSRAGWWVFATYLGWTLGFVYLFTIGEGFLISLPWLGVIAGAPSGFLLVSWLGPMEEAGEHGALQGAAES